MSWQNRVQDFKVGDAVCYKSSFLRNTGQYAGESPHARGVITELKPLGETTIALIDWGNPEIPCKVNTKNLSKVTERGIADE